MCYDCFVAEAFQSKSDSFLQANTVTFALQVAQRSFSRATPNCSELMDK